MPDLSPDELDELYAAAPAEFVATRDALVRRRREAGDKEGARAVARLRRPTRAAHAVNQLARNEPDALAAYLDLGERIRSAQVAAARDERARDELRTLDRERRTRLAALLATVTDDRDDVERALAVALVDPEHAEATRTGRLDRIPESLSGFAGFGDELAEAPVPTARKKDAIDTRHQARVRELEENLRTANAAVAAAKSEVRDARAAVARAERQLRDAERRAERIQSERERLER
jgi:hypothetical protein